MNKEKINKAISVITGFVLALAFCIGLPQNAINADSGASKAYDNPFNYQNDEIVQYDRSRWIQPREWNCPTINPNDYTGGTMLYFDKIGLKPETAPGTVQRIYFSIANATEPVSHIKFHFFYDTRLTVKQNDDNDFITAGKGLEGFTTGSAMVEEGELVFYAYSPEDKLLDNCCIFTVDFIVPQDAEQGEIYPFGLAYVVDDVAADTFIDTEQSDAGKLQMTYMFTKGIYTGYIFIIGEKITTATTTTVTTTTTTPAPVAQLGDVNGDGLIDGADASLVLYANANGIDENLTEEQKKAADINGDGLIDGVDASLILVFNVRITDEPELTIEDFIRELFASLRK